MPRWALWIRHRERPAGARRLAAVGRNPGRQPRRCPRVVRGNSCDFRKSGPFAAGAKCARETHSSTDPALYDPLSAFDGIRGARTGGFEHRRRPSARGKRKKDRRDGPGMRRDYPARMRAHAGSKEVPGAWNLTHDDSGWADGDDNVAVQGWATSTRDANDPTWLSGTTDWPARIERLPASQLRGRTPNDRR